MEPLWLGIAGILLLFMFLAMGVYVPVALGLVGFIGTAIILSPTIAIKSIGTLSFFKVQDFGLSVIPMFVLMGFLATSAGITSKLYESLELWLGRIKGGLGIATAGACTAFGTLCGSSLVVASVFSQVSVPEMKRHGYDKRFAYGIVSSTANIGMLIPPSVLIVIYGFLTEESIGKLLIAGISPGLMLFVVFSIGIWAMVVRNPRLAPTRTERVPILKKLSATRYFVVPAITALIIIGGIYLGVFTPSEAGAIAALLLLIIALISRRPWLEIGSSMLSTVTTTAMIFLLLVTAAIFARFLALSGITLSLVDLVVDSGLSSWGVIIASAFLFLLLGTVLDGISALTIAIPLLYPVVTSLGINPFHYAMVVMVAVHIGTITPPVGLNVYGIKAVVGDDISLGELFKGALPFLVMMIITLALYIAFPVLSYWLPEHIR